MLLTLATPNVEGKVQWEIPWHLTRVTLGILGARAAQTAGAPNVGGELHGSSHGTFTPNSGGTRCEQRVRLLTPGAPNVGGEGAMGAPMAPYPQH